jgi:hypothetical protein
MYCGSCIDGWLSENETCPNCTQKFETGSLSRAAKAVFDKMWFSCLTCDTDYAYNQAAQHQAICLVSDQVCLLQCGDQAKFRDWKSMKSHLLDSCPLFKHTCCTCEEAAYKEKPHNCIDELLRKVKHCSKKFKRSLK